MLGSLLGAVLTATGLGGRRQATRAQECTNPVACVTTADCCPGSVCEGSRCLRDDLPPPCLLEGEVCTEPAECCSGECGEGVCVGNFPPCRTDGEPCTEFGDECCSGRCAEGVCTSCLEEGADCVEFFDCCSFSCVEGVCAEEEDLPPIPDLCLGVGEPCTDALDCCFGPCQDGVCAPCPEEGTPCIASDECCPDLGLFCESGVCTSDIECFDTPCAISADCCQIPEFPFVCEDGVCVFESTLCLPDGATCGGIVECCPGSGCVDGTCQTLDDGSVGPGGGDDGSGGEVVPDPPGEVVIRLPATGASTSDMGSGPLGELTVAAGVAALLASRVLHRRVGGLEPESLPGDGST